MADLIHGNRQRLRSQRHAIELCRQINHRSIAARTHIRNDLRYGGIHIRAVFAFGVQKRGECGLKIRLAVV